MDEVFYQWLMNIGRTHNTAYSYKNAINHISEHFSQNTQNNINIYALTSHEQISDIAHQYSQAGHFAEAGYNGNGTWRNAIARYSEFFANRNNIENIDVEVETIPNQPNFAYERDLQRTLCSQISQLFPEYKIYGENDEGVEFSVGGRRIDVLLEHLEDQSLLVVELKSGEADFRVFGQISMYLGLLQTEFPDRSITGIIIAGAIDESLSNACLITDRVSLKVYRMSLELENV